MSALDVAKTVFVVGLFVLFGYFIVPLIFPSTFHQAIFFAIVMTGANMVGVITSWKYFYNTRCYPDEGNLVTMYSYKVFGASATHLVLLITRLSGNIINVAFAILWPDSLAFEFPFLWYLKIYLLSTSFATGMYLYEAINNCIKIASGVDFKCQERSLMCGSIKDPIFCDAD